MKVVPSRSFEQIRKLRRRVNDVPGAVVIGGDYQGLGIVRSLGRQGIPICILDDEHSISRYSLRLRLSMEFEFRTCEMKTW